MRSLTLILLLALVLVVLGARFRNNGKIKLTINKKKQSKKILKAVGSSLIGCNKLKLQKCRCMYEVLLKLPMTDVKPIRKATIKRKIKKMPRCMKKVKFVKKIWLLQAGTIQSILHSKNCKIKEFPMKQERAVTRRISRRRKIIVKNKDLSTKIIESRNIIRKSTKTQAVQRSRMICTKVMRRKRANKNINRLTRLNKGDDKLTEEDKEDVIKEIIKSTDDDNGEDEIENEKEKNQEVLAVEKIDDLMKSFEDFDAKVDFENITEFVQWIETITNLQEFVEDYESRLSGNIIQIQVRVEKIESLIHAKLSMLFLQPSPSARKILGELFRFENLIQSDNVLRFIEEISDDSDDDDEDVEDETNDETNELDDTVTQKTKGEKEKEDKEDSIQPKPQIFDLNTMILCAKDNLEGIACVHVDITKICTTKEKGGIKSVDVKGYNISSIFLPPGMTIRIIREDQHAITSLRGPFVWTHRELFSSAVKIEIFTSKDIPAVDSDTGDRNYYIINADVVNDKDNTIGKTRWSNSIYKRYLCIGGQNTNRFNGINIRRSSLKIFVPEGVKIHLKKKKCGQKGKFGKMALEGPIEVDMGKGKMMAYNQIYFPDGIKLPVLPGAKENEMNNVNDNDGEKDKGEDDDDDNDDDDDDDDEGGKMSLCVRKECVTGTSIGELKSKAGEMEKMKDLSMALVNVPSDTYLPLPMTSPKMCGALPRQIIHGDVTLKLSDLDGVSEDIELVDETESDDNEDDTIGERKSFLGRYNHKFLPGEYPYKRQFTNASGDLSLGSITQQGQNTF